LVEDLQDPVLALGNEHGQNDMCNSLTLASNSCRSEQQVNGSGKKSTPK
jgi:hypothetical protein